MAARRFSPPKRARRAAAVDEYRVTRSHVCLTQIYTARVGIRVYMSNRVEDLERQVAELQAAVNGLTEELVEMKERVRQVEDAQEVSVRADAASEDAGTAEAAEQPAETADASGGETRTHSDDHVEVVERTGGDESADEAAGTGADAEGGDMVVPEQEATTPDAETGESEAAGDDEESDSDIIVA